MQKLLKNLYLRLISYSKNWKYIVLCLQISSLNLVNILYMFSLLAKFFIEMLMRCASVKAQDIFWSSRLRVTLRLVFWKFDSLVSLVWTVKLNLLTLSRHEVFSLCLFSYETSLLTSISDGQIHPDDLYHLI